MIEGDVFVPIPALKMPKVAVYTGMRYGKPIGNYYSLSVGYRALPDVSKEQWSVEIPPLSKAPHIPDFGTLVEEPELAAAYQKWLGRDLPSVLSATGIGQLGCDPEIFVTVGGRVYPAWEFLPHRKTAKPHTISAYWDGFQAEFCTPANGCLAYLVDSAQAGLKAVLNAARKKEPKAELCLDSVIEAPAEILATAAMEHVELGCDPSRNVYGLHGLPVQDGRSLPLRTVGGHIHLGCGRLPEETDRNIITAIDAVAGVPLVAIFRSDLPIRRTLYGLPGEYRTPKHGLEYRSLSNAWLGAPVLMHFTFDLVRAAAKLGKARVAQLWNYNEDEVCRIITECDVKAAVQYVEDRREMYEKLFEAIYTSRSVPQVGTSTKARVEHSIELIRNGAGYAVAEPTNVEKNWRLGGEWMTHSDGEGCQWHNAVKLLESGKKI